ncbi:MAG: T9SS type A sorting domain-containing protein [Bacteroidota bacterium]
MRIKITLFFLLTFGFITLNAANYYWVNGSGSWSNFASHWATTSGGTVFHTQVPQSTDDVFFDANSFIAAGQIVTVDQPIVQCANMTWTGVTNTPSLYGNYTNTLKIYGSLTLAVGMKFNFEGPLSFEATTSGKTITSAGKILNTSITFNGIGGGWSLSDVLTANWIYLNNGTLTTNNQTVNAFAFTSNTASARTLNMGTSTFNLSFYGPMWKINPVGMTMNASASTIKGVAVSGGAQDFYGGGFLYNNIFFTGTQSGKINGNSAINNVSFAADGYIQCNCAFNDVAFGANAFLTSNSTYNNVTIVGDGDIVSSNTFNNLVLSPDHKYTLQSGKTQTINTSLTANGNCSALINIKASASGLQSTIAKTSGTVNLAYVTLKDIKTSGGAVFVATNANDLGNNTGWTMTSLISRNLYWVGNGGNWNDGNHWSTASGGAPAGCLPTSADNVFFDANSFSLPNQTITVNVPAASVQNMVWTGVTNSPVFHGDYTNTLNIFGSLSLVSAMTFDFTGSLDFEATLPDQTITTAGKTINTSISFNGIGGSWTLQDDLKCDYWIYLNNGALNTNNKTVNAYAFTSSTASSRALNMGSSVFNLSFNGSIWKINPTGMNLNSGTSTINGVGFNGGQQDFYGGGFTYNNINFVGAALGKIIDNNTINDLFFGSDGIIQGGNFHNIDFTSDATLYYTNSCNNVTIAENANIIGSNTFNSLTLSPGYSYTLAAGATQTIITSLTASGNCGALIEIKSGTPGIQSFIYKAAGIVTLSDMSLKDISVTGGAVFIANNLNDLSNNAGWTVGPLGALTSKNLYWVGNGGNWNDGNHWSLTSGGIPAGCSPTTLDNVFFDANSFTTVGQTVSVNVPAAFANNMVWTGVTNNPTFYGDYANSLKIYGSFTLAAGMIMDFTGPVFFEATSTGKNLTFAGKVINTSLTFNGIGGSWTLQDALTCNYWIYLNNGALTTNNKTVNAHAFNSTTSSARALNMGSSVFNLTFNGLIWNINPLGMVLNAGSSTINGVGATGGQQDFYGGGFTYNNIFFIGLGLGKIIDANTIHDVSFAADGYIQGGTFNDITFSGNAVMYYTNICHNVTIAKDADILGSNTFNYLKLSPGYTYTLTSGTTQTILAGGDVCAQGTGSLPIRIQSSNDGVPATISKASGTICWDYVRLSDINAVGGAVFNAGLTPINSQNMGGTSGFLFTGGCLISTCSACIPALIATPPNNVSVCKGSNATFAITALGTGLTYQWQVSQGITFVNLTNTAPYTGVTTSTLNVIAAADALNGYKYRCIVTGVCGTVQTSIAGTLTVNVLPIVTSSVNASTITVYATGGLSPYTGSGIFSGLAPGTYTKTIIDARGCSASTTATVTVSISDNIPPVAICKNASVTLSNGTASITPTMINNGSYDNVAIASITVSPSVFTCTNIGTNTVTLTVKDIIGNTSTCQSIVTVSGALPTCSIQVTPSNSTYTGGVSTNLYLGYGPASLTLTALPTGFGTFTYSWSGSSFLSSSTSKSVTFTPALPGQYVLICTIRNSYGCETNCSVIICVKDIRIPNKAGKVYLCHLPPGNVNNPQTLSVSINAVPSHIGNHAGDQLGDCSATCGETSGRRMEDGELFSFETSTGDVDLIVYPNPTAGSFNFQLETTSDELVSIKVYDLTGRILYNVTNLSPKELITIGSEFKPGMFMAEVTQGEFMKVVRLNKVN